MDPSSYSKMTPIGQGLTHKGTPSPRRAAAPSRLGAIDENGGMSPDAPKRSEHRAMKQRVLEFAFPPTLHASRQPPGYTEYGDDPIGPKGEKFSDLRRNRGAPPKRGGKIRLMLLAAVIVAIIIALAIGLGVGLSKKKSDNPQLPAPIANLTFPAGSYSFTTFLASVSTVCTSSSTTWLCYPYQTYNQSTSNSEATFNWIISANSTTSTTSSNNTNYVISSSNDPFALTFTNASMNLINPGSTHEAYTFSVPMQKVVIPTASITSDNSAAKCYYNNTIFSATLYTKLPKTYPTGSGQSTNPDPSATYGQWPYAVDIQEVIDGGPGVPDCYETNNGAIGVGVSIPTTASSDQCSCVYMNYGT